jgi:septal ring factor EnvC (AmiA/AmiB activator)
MNKRLVFVVGVLLTGALAWTAFAQPQGGGRGGFGQMREAQVKAIAALQEQVGKLKAMMEQQPAARGNFQDMTDEERTKMREEMTKRRDEQTAIIAAIQQQVDTLKGARLMMTDHQAAMTPLKDLLASAQAEKATATAAKIEKLIAEKQKAFEEKVTAMGYTMEQMDRMMQMGQRRGQ